MDLDSFLDPYTIKYFRNKLIPTIKTCITRLEADGINESIEHSTLGSVEFGFDGLKVERVEIPDDGVSLRFEGPKVSLKGKTAVERDSKIRLTMYCTPLHSSPLGTQLLSQIFPPIRFPSSKIALARQDDFLLLVTDEFDGTNLLRFYCREQAEIHLREFEWYYKKELVFPKIRVPSSLFFSALPFLRVPNIVASLLIQSIWPILRLYRTTEKPTRG